MNIAPHTSERVILLDTERGERLPSVLITNSTDDPIWVGEITIDGRRYMVAPMVDATGVF